MDPPKRGARVPSAKPLFRVIAAIQAAYFLITGIWPILHIDSFLEVTGPKTDLWLVRLFGALVCVPGLVLLQAAWTGRVPAAVTLTALSACAVLGAGDVIFFLRGDIGAIYLADAALEAVFFAAWVAAIFAGKSKE
jgi:hypothetical protein